jgi:ABC-type multidrug transport system fused ATPase/permease subunit
MSRRRSRSWWRPILLVFRGRRRALVLAVLLSIAQAAMLLPVAYLVKLCFDDYIPRGENGKLVLAALATLGLFLAQGLIGLLGRYVSLTVTNDAIVALRGRLMERIYALPKLFFDAHEDGRIQSIVVQDSERIAAMVVAFVALLLPAAVTAAGLAAVLAVIEPTLLLWLLVVVPVLLVTGRLLRRRLQLHVREWTRVFEVFAARTALALRTRTLTDVQGAARYELERRRTEHAELGDAALRMAWSQSLYAIVQGAIAASAGVVVLIVGGRAVADGDLSLGSLLAFYAILALLLRQVQAVFTAMPIVLAGRESLDRLDVVLEAPDAEPYRGTRRIEFRGGIELSGVSFGYDRGTVLHDVSLRIEPGERVLLLGPNGAGKSTVANLVLGLYRPGEGEVRADGVPYDELDLVALRRSMGVVLQDPVIFPGTVRANIAYGRPDATDEAVERAARLAGVDEVVAELPDGYDTEVGDEGQLLSGGQRQRIAIARALVAAPALLVLDEPSTHLDDRAIGSFMRVLSELPGRPTVVMISHDPALSARADVVARLRDGRLTAVEHPLATA